MAEESKKLTSEIKERVWGYLVGALGLVAGIAWNDAVRALIDTLFPVAKDGIAMKFAYAAIVTLVIIIVTFYLILRPFIPYQKRHYGRV